MPSTRSSSKISIGKALLIPAAADYRMPAEWEPHVSTWLAWPHYQGDWPAKFEPIPWVYAEIIRNLAKHERVELIVNNATAAKQARRVLERADALSDNIRFHRWPTNRVWLRDSGCVFLKESHMPGETHVGAAAFGRPGPEARQTSALKFRFNAWAKYSNWRLDEKIGSLMAKAAHANEIRPESLGSRIVLEGGSIDVNGVGTILTTEECLLSKEQERNPHMTRVQYEKAFADYLAAPHTIWLGRGIVGDDTHGHVDDLTRFVRKDLVITMVERDSKDMNHAPLLANLRRLQSARDQDGKQLTVVELPMPQPVVFEGRRLPASYANFYIANGVVLAPVFNRPNDRIALNTLGRALPYSPNCPHLLRRFHLGPGRNALHDAAAASLNYHGDTESRRGKHS